MPQIIDAGWKDVVYVPLRDGGKVLDVLHSSDILLSISERLCPEPLP